MKTRILAVIALSLTLTLSARAQVPGIINYQGRIVDGGTNFNGTGLFQFALLGATNVARQATATAAVNSGFITSYNVVSGGLGYTSSPTVTITDCGTGSGALAFANISAGMVTSIVVSNGMVGGNYSCPTVTIAPPPPDLVTSPLWSNGVNTVSLPVVKGLYSVLLGDTTLANMGSSIPAAVFTNNDVVLRVWFNDGVNGLQQLSPDQRIAAAGYALNAAMAQTAVNIVPTSDVTGQRLNIGVDNVLSGTLSTIAGGSNNTASAEYATAGGGAGNVVTGIGSFIGGGGYDGLTFGGNTNTANASVISGGLGNTIQISASDSTIDGGDHNTIQANADASTIDGGDHNTIQASAEISTIGGGEANTIQTNNTGSTIGGGGGNTIQINASDSTISGGQFNKIQTNAQYSTIGGGSGNTIQYNAQDSTIGGGEGNQATGPGSFVGGGGYDGATVAGNTASGPASTIGGGLGNTIQNNASYSFVGGGRGNTVSGSYGTVPGGEGNTASGPGSFVGGGGYDGLNSLGNAANGPASTVGGGIENTIQNNASYSFIGGGNANTIQASSSFIGGGLSNTIQVTAVLSFIGSGRNNAILSNAFDSAIAGGRYNTILSNAFYAAIGGGNSNIVSDQYGTIPGGFHNVATNNAFAAGTSAIASNTGAFVWSDDSGSSFASTSNNQFSVRASGGVAFFSNAGATTGVILPPGSGSWNSASDRNLKAHFATVNAEAILQALVATPVDIWNYKSQDDHIHHIGPMAQDFYAAFGVGEDDRHISEVDAQGVAFAAIQGLNQKLEEQVKGKESEIRELRARLEQMEKRLEKVSEQVEPSKDAPQPAANVHKQGGM